ncbi:MAG: alpha/beta fold hydrolase [Planctomycetota bacterium]
MRRSKPSWVKRLTRLGVIAIGLPAGAAVLLWGCQRSAMYPGVWLDPVPAPPPPAGAERWTRDVPGGVVEAIFLPGEGATPDRPGPAVIFCHGNGEFIGGWAHEFGWLTRRGVSVLLPEYRGYAPSGGKPSQPAILEDLEHFRQRLVERPGVDADRLIYIGRSLGGGFVAQLADRHPPAALVLSSTFTSAADAARDLTRLPGALVRDRLEVRGVLHNFRGPVLILHGRDDRVIDVRHAEANAAAAADATLIVYDRAGHDTMPQGLGRRADLIDFLVAHDLVDAPRPTPTMPPPTPNRPDESGPTP